MKQETVLQVCLVTKTLWSCIIYTPPPISHFCRFSAAANKSGGSSAHCSCCWSDVRQDTDQSTGLSSSLLPPSLPSGRSKHTLPQVPDIDADCRFVFAFVFVFVFLFVFVFVFVIGYLPQVQDRHQRRLQVRLLEQKDCNLEPAVSFLLLSLTLSVATQVEASRPWQSRNCHWAAQASRFNSSSC